MSYSFKTDMYTHTFQCSNQQFWMKALVLFRMHFSPIYYHSQTCSYALFINPNPILSLEAAQFSRKFQLDSTLCSRKFPHQSRFDALTLSKIISWGEKMYNQPSKFPQKESKRKLLQFMTTDRWRLCAQCSSWKMFIASNNSEYSIRLWSSHLLPPHIQHIQAIVSAEHDGYPFHPIPSNFRIVSKFHSCCADWNGTTASSFGQYLQKYFNSYHYQHLNVGLFYLWEKLVTK